MKTIVEEHNEIVEAERTARRNYKEAVAYLRSIGVEVQWSAIKFRTDSLLEEKDNANKYHFQISFIKDGSGFSYEFSQAWRKAVDLIMWRPRSIHNVRHKQRVIDAENCVPDLWAALSCLESDCSVQNYSCFEEWAEDLGLDTDSRKAERTYNFCHDIARKASKIFDLEELHAYLEENDKL